MRRAHRQTAIELLEARRLCDTVSVQTEAPPQVTHVYISGSEWTQTFRDHLRDTVGGSSEHGDLIWNFTATTLRPAWVNINQVTVIFDRDVTVEADDLRVRGVNSPEYPVASFRYETDAGGSSTTATWVMAGRGLFRADWLLIEVNGGEDGVHQRQSKQPLDGDGDGVAGGNFLHRQAVLPAGSGSPFARTVRYADWRLVRTLQKRSLDRPGEIGHDYYAPSDSNGDGQINAIDLANVRRRLYTQLPPPQPTVAPAGNATPLRTRPVARTLFSSAPILA